MMATNGIVMMLFVFGAAFSPVAAVKSWRYARQRELNPVKYASCGALYSMLLFLPWQFLLPQIEGRRVSSRELMWVYVFLFVFLWILGEIFLVFFSFWVSAASYGKADVREFTLYLLLVSISLLIASGIALMWRASIDRRNATLMSPIGGEFPHVIYVMPMAFLVSLEAVATFAFYRALD